jgi:predicted XRE-type DNA-binding protein
VTRSSGNVFRDVGFPSELNTCVRSDLLMQLLKAMASRGMKQPEPAKVLQVRQPRVSDLLSG